MTESISDKVDGFKASILLKGKFCKFTLQTFCQLFRNTYLQECILMAAFGIYFLRLFPLSRK